MTYLIILFTLLTPPSNAVIEASELCAMARDSQGKSTHRLEKLGDTIICKRVK